MLEGEATRRLRKALETHPLLVERNAMVLRHVNFYTAGVLDLSVSIGQFTLWLELKMLGRKLTALQALNIKKLNGGGAVVTFDNNGRTGMITNRDPKYFWMESPYLSFEQLVEEIVSRCIEGAA